VKCTEFDYKREKEIGPCLPCSEDEDKQLKQVNNYNVYKILQNQEGNSIVNSSFITIAPLGMGKDNNEGVGEGTRNNDYDKA
jgi:hypothetical protein